MHQNEGMATAAPALSRGIGKRDLVLMIINSIIGAGIFGLPSKIFALTGVYSLLAFVFCAAIVLLFILCFAEVGSRFDATGGPYVYVQTAFGPFPAFMVGWLLLLSRIFNYATLINLLVTYSAVFHPALNETVPRAVLILVITGALTLINYRGVKHTALISTILTIAKLTTLALFIIAGFFLMDTSRFTAGSAPPFSSFSNAVLLLVFAFGGFESVMVNTGEIRDPARTIPSGLLTATGVVAIFYILIQVVCIGTLPGLAHSEKPLADAATTFVGPTGGKLIAAGAVISILGTLNVLLLSGSRLPYAFSLEGQLPPVFSYVHPRFQTPTTSLLTAALITAAASVAWSFLTALAVAVIIRVAVYLFVCAALIRLRKRLPGQTRFYKLPGGKAIALLGIAVLLWLLSSAKAVELRNVALFLAVGIAIYFYGRGRFRRKEAKE